MPKRTASRCRRRRAAAGIDASIAPAARRKAQAPHPCAARPPRARLAAHAHRRLGTASTAWHELSRPPASPPPKDGDAQPFRRAVAAIKEVAAAVRAEWAPQYNLCTHADGTVETEADSVIEGGVPFNFSDRYGEAWRVHLARLNECTDACAPLTGPRVTHALFDDMHSEGLPLDYSDQHCEHELAEKAKELGTLDVEARVATQGFRYEKAIRARWMRDRPNQPLSDKRVAAMVATRAGLELAKEALALERVPAPSPEPEPEPGRWRHPLWTTPVPIPRRRPRPTRAAPRAGGRAGTRRSTPSRRPVRPPPTLWFRK